MKAKTNLLEKNPVFFDADFRDDLKALKSASPAVIKSLAKWLATVESADDLGDSDKWIPVLKETGLVLDALQKVVKPVLWMADLCARKHVSMADLVDDLAESGIVGNGAQRKATKQKLLALGSPLEPLLQKAEVKASPELPLLYVKAIKTRCVFISEFDKEYNLETDTASSYKPGLRSLHPRVTLQLTFRDEAHEPIGILLSPSNLKDFKGFLEMAEVQLKAAARALPKAKVIHPN